MNATLEAMARALFRSWFVDFDPVRAKMEGRDTGLPKDIADLFPDRHGGTRLGRIPEGLDRLGCFDIPARLKGLNRPASVATDTLTSDWNHPRRSVRPIGQRVEGNKCLREWGQSSELRPYFAQGGRADERRAQHVVQERGCHPPSFSLRPSAGFVGKPPTATKSLEQRQTMPADTSCVGTDCYRDRSAWCRRRWRGSSRMNAGGSRWTRAEAGFGPRFVEKLSTPCGPRQEPVRDQPKAVPRPWPTWFSRPARPGQRRSSSHGGRARADRPSTSS